MRRLFEKLLEFLTLLGSEAAANAFANFLPFLLHFRADQVPKNFYARVALVKNFVDAIGLIRAELQFFFEPFLETLLKKDRWNRWLGRFRRETLHQHSASQRARGENHDRRQNDFPDFHWTSSAGPALANTARSNSCENSALLCW